MKLYTILLSISIITILSCQVKNKVNPTNEKVETNKLVSSNDIDFELIKSWVKDKKVVAIGESTHGLGEFYTMKSEIVKYLHKEMGYEVLAMEGNFGDISLSWNNINDMDFLELRNNTVFGNFRCQEIEPLFKYIKENSQTDKPLLYTGYDPQISGDYYENYLVSISDQLNLGIDVKEEFIAYFKMYQSSFELDSINFTKYKEGYQKTLSTLKDAITKNRASLQKNMMLSDLTLDIILKSLAMQHKVVDYSYANKVNDEYMHQGIVLRDKIMAENMTWIIENLYPDKKILIWGYNGHIQKGGSSNMSTKMMGQHLKDRYGDDYFSIGLFAYEGNAYQHWTGKSIEFENSDSIAIENIMKRDSFQYSFHRFSNDDPSDWTNKEVTGFEIESTGKVSFVPSDRFDAGISIYRGDIPTFGKKD